MTGTPVDDGWFTLQVEPTEFTMSILPMTGWTVGTHKMTLLVSLANYPVLTPKVGLEIAFEITVDSVCSNTKFFIP